MTAQDQKAEQGQIAFTFDDLPQAGPALSLSRAEEMTAKLLDGLKRKGVPVVAFVNEKKLFVPGETDARIALLRSWLEAGHELGNHTFSHPSFQTTPLRAFEEEIVRGETVTSLLLRERGAKLRWFRHPFLQTGPTHAARAALEKFLAGRGYTVAPVSVDNSDWIFAAVYSDARTAGDAALMEKLRAAYLDYVGEMLGFFETLSRDVLGRAMRHVLLVHANELNADTIDRVADLSTKARLPFRNARGCAGRPGLGAPRRLCRPERGLLAAPMAFHQNREDAAQGRARASRLRHDSLQGAPLRIGPATAATWFRGPSSPAR